MWGDRSWGDLWRLEVPNKLKLFIWQCCNHSLEVRCNLIKRRMQMDSKCVMCGEAEEMKHHLFFQCPFSQVFWYCCFLQLDVALVVGRDFYEY